MQHIRLLQVQCTLPSNVCWIVIICGAITGYVYLHILVYLNQIRHLRKLIRISHLHSWPMEKVCKFGETKGAVFTNDGCLPGWSWPSCQLWPYSWTGVCWLLQNWSTGKGQDNNPVLWLPTGVDGISDIELIKRPSSCWVSILEVKLYSILLFW